MSQIPEEKLLQHISDGVSQLTPDRAEELWQKPVPLADGTEWYLDSAGKRRKSSHKKYYLGAVAACLILCFCASFFFQLMPSASVYLDVNPSISLDVNYRNRVTGVTACNEDAVKVLGDMDFKGTDLDVALYAILGSMVRNGYLTESKDTVLVSVQCANTGRANELESEVSSMVSESLKNMINAGEVLSQQVEDTEKVTGENQFTPGKAAFINDLKEKYPQLKDNFPEDLTIDEIVSLLKENGLDYSDYKSDNDDDEVDDNDAVDTDNSDAGDNDNIDDDDIADNDDNDDNAGNDIASNSNADTGSADTGNADDDNADDDDTDSNNADDDDTGTDEADTDDDE